MRTDHEAKTAGRKKAGETRAAEGIAYARVGLLGNPSDGYGGKAIAMSLENFRAEASIAPAERFEIFAGATDQLVFPSVRHAAEAYERHGCDDGLRLVRAAVRRFFLHADLAGPAEIPGDDRRLRFSIRYQTDIPRQVGLSGSSAIVIAVMRALMSWFEHEIEAAELAELALAAEVEDLGLAGGAMDRVIQAYGGVVVMDLREPRSAASYRRLEPDLLPALFVAFNPRGGEPSSRAHGELRARWERGDPRLREVMQELRELADAGVEALEAGDADAFRALIDRNFDMRSSFFPISEADRRMVAIARSMGAAAKLSGSGGAVVGLPREASEMQRLRELYEAEGFRMVRPERAQST